MTLRDQLHSELASLGTVHVAPGAPAHGVDLADGDRSLHGEFLALDRVGCEFVALSVKTPKLRGASTERLQQIAQALSAKLTYLLEPISPIEVDHQQCVVQMRSSPPQKNDDGTTYYELLVRAGGELALSRFTKAVGSVRQPVAAQVTREVLLRLVGDLEQAV
jgi:hypothetical protein